MHERALVSIDLLFYLKSALYIAFEFPLYVMNESGALLERFYSGFQINSWKGKRYPVVFIPVEVGKGQFG